MDAFQDKEKFIQTVRNVLEQADKFTGDTVAVMVVVACDYDGDLAIHSYINGHPDAIRKSAHAVDTHVHEDFPETNENTIN